jgi:hypothetical protein
MPNHSDLIIVWLCRLWDGVVRRRRPLCEGVPISQQASELLPQLQAREFVPKALLLINLYLRHWHKHLRASLVPLVEAYRTGLETGDLEHATFAIAFHAYHSYLVGRDLTQIEPGMTEYGEANPVQAGASSLHQPDLSASSVEFNGPLRRFLSARGRVTRYFCMIGDRTEPRMRTA